MNIAEDDIVVNLEALEDDRPGLFPSYPEKVRDWLHMLYGDNPIITGLYVSVVGEVTFEDWYGPSVVSSVDVEEALVVTAYIESDSEDGDFCIPEELRPLITEHWYSEIVEAVGNFAENER